MREKTLQIIFFGLSAAILLALLFFILKPFLGVIFLSAVLSVAFYPIYLKLLNRFEGRKSLAALLTTLIVIVCIVIPVALLSAALLREAVGLYNSVVLGGDSSDFFHKVNQMGGQITNFFPKSLVENSGINFEIYARDTLNWIISHFNSIFAAVFDGLFKFILMLLALYYLLISGDKIKTGILAWSPLKDSYDEAFLQALRSSVNAVLYSRILVSAIQGLFIGIGFTIFGVGNPVLWGFIGGIASLIPILGTSVIVVPAAAYLLISGNIGSGLGLIIWGAFAVGLIDNVFALLFFKGKIKIHPLLVLLSILGGVELFGVIGFLIGPVVVSALLSLLKIYPFIIPRKE